MKKKLEFVSLALLLTLLITSTVLASEAMGNLVKLKQATDWATGEFTGVALNTDKSGVVLEKVGDTYQQTGTYLTGVLPLPAFNRAVPSWNALTPEGTHITIDIQFKVNNQWSDWLSLGAWGTSYARKSADGSKNAMGSIDTDTLMVSGDTPADALRIKIGLYGDGKNTPILEELAVTSYLTSATPETTVAVTGTWQRELDVPQRSQMIENQEVAGRICSPTSLSMVLAYYGIDKTTKEIYDLAYDTGADIYGNWPFNTAVAGSFGLEGYVDYYFTVDELKQRIAEGIPVICSIRFKSGQLQGAPISSTNGHLVVVKGFVTRDGQEYVICNDPAAMSNAEVRREYKVEQFAGVWKGWVYIISKR